MSAQGASADWDPLTPLTGDRIKIRASDGAPLFHSPDPASTGARQCLASTESRCLPSRETSTGALSSLGWALCPGWPARTGAARVHRGLGTATRPLFVRSSRAPSRPRALSRLLQPMFPRARPRTTSNIPNDRKPSLGRLPRIESRLSMGASRQSCSRSGTEKHRSSALPTGIALHGDFAPTSTASGTSCREDRSSPCPERRGRTAEPPARRTLARSAQRQGRAAPHLREEARRSPTRGAFHRQAIRIADGSRSDHLENQAAPHGSAFFTVDRPGRGTLARALTARPRDDGKRLHALLSVDRSAPDDFCVRVEVRSQMCRRTSDTQHAWIGTLAQTKKSVGGKKVVHRLIHSGGPNCRTLRGSHERGVVCDFP